MPTIAADMLLVVACALVDGDGRVLVAQRPEGKAMAGLWEFPGGKVEPHETPEAALIRELKEELSIDVTAACLAPLSFASHAYAEFSFADAALCVPQMGGPTARQRGAAPSVEKTARLI